MVSSRSGWLAIVLFTACGLGVAGKTTAQEQQPATSEPAPQDGDSAALVEFLRNTKVAVNMDGYYAWNTNRPIGRVNLLRAYDVTSNNFSLNQAGLIVDHAPDPDQGRRAGLRFDLMYGQATETLQGSAQNEPRPQVYRPVFQAYGSYVFPVGSGLQVDFGKFASALGVENNYTKDQINYSRSYFFNFLPFYHMGVRATYTPDSAVSLTYWLVNGAQQTEDFNGFKSQAAIITLKPASSVIWNVNYYTGREGRDLVPDLNPGQTLLPTQPGLSTQPAVNPDRSRLHILDTYASWNVTQKLTLLAEGDYVTVRGAASNSPRVFGGAAYAQYRMTPIVHVGARTTYMSDHDGLFSGVGQNLHDLTGTVTWFADPRFMIRGEVRRDWSTVPFFLTDVPGDRSRSQTTFTAGLVWWIGNKEGIW
jgi:hypothetical protein